VRAQVNYAEPSLNSKMRRPTKEMLDAVGRDGRPLTGIVSSGKGVVVKLEPDEEGAMQAEPGSPLGNKSNLPPIPMEADEVPLRRTGVQPQTAASKAIAALLSESKTGKRKSSMLRPDTIETKKDPGMAIYDFTSSSPPRTVSTSSRPSSREEVRGSRRASTGVGVGVGGTGTRFGSTAHKRVGSGNLAAAARKVEPEVKVNVEKVAEVVEEVKPDLRVSTRRRSMML